MTLPLLQMFLQLLQCCNRLGTATGVVLVVGGVALYIRFVKGWKLSDLMYVTRSSLSSMTESMKSGEARGLMTAGDGARAIIATGQQWWKRMLQQADSTLGFAHLRGKYGALIVEPCSGFAAWARRPLHSCTAR